MENDQKKINFLYKKILKTCLTKIARFDLRSQTNHEFIKYTLAAAQSRKIIICFTIFFFQFNFKIITLCIETNNIQKC